MAFTYPSQADVPPERAPLEATGNRALKWHYFSCTAWLRYHFSFPWHFSFLWLYLMVSRQGLKLTLLRNSEKKMAWKEITVTRKGKGKNKLPHLDYERKRRIAWLWVWAPVPDSEGSVLGLTVCAHSMITVTQGSCRNFYFLWLNELAISKFISDFLLYTWYKNDFVHSPLAIHAIKCETIITL